DLTIIAMGTEKIDFEIVLVRTGPCAQALALTGKRIGGYGGKCGEAWAALFLEICIVPSVV
ncbi:MAG TPA: hypothetical protein PLA90_19125, partial [Candidatus Sumerlaeota bacterium]|nr:hypothetical protein [Candidatus Sumerlaeota bacterium]